MRRQPTTQKIGAPREVLGPPRPPSSSFEGDVIQPFLVSGGLTFYQVSVDDNFDPRPAGVQLCAYLYVPKGHNAFVKEIRIAPFIPPELADPWETNGVLEATLTGASWRDFDLANPGSASIPRAAGTHGVWTTPFGWESYFDSAGTPPQWQWFLRMLKGNPVAQQLAARNFDPTDPTSWPLQPNIPVPLTAYRNGIPGQPPSAFWGPQRMQVLQGDKLSTHVLVPEDTTIALFTRWQQNTFTPIAVFFDGEGTGRGAYGDAVYPLLPSFGQLHGYLQSLSAEPTTENARYGWGG